MRPFMLELCANMSPANAMAVLKIVPMIHFVSLLIVIGPGPCER